MLKKRKVFKIVKGVKSSLLQNIKKFDGRPFGDI